MIKLHRMTDDGCRRRVGGWLAATRRTGFDGSVGNGFAAKFFGTKQGLDYGSLQITCDMCMCNVLCLCTSKSSAYLGENKTCRRDES